ncbi:hypothetical protein CU098_004735 [Rhizopus stolonifer]|uniref:RING-type domain-containing protein n=1 Tax=Rhizopus stolonifer TaxID=4846 RepID=A0A367K499_RHIST|nr:hypothetical protein CU098_004735 [Rhizopus stolonifer]
MQQDSINETASAKRDLPKCPICEYRIEPAYWADHYQYELGRLAEPTSEAYLNPSNQNKGKRGAAVAAKRQLEGKGKKKASVYEETLERIQKNRTQRADRLRNMNQTGPVEAETQHDSEVALRVMMEEQEGSSEVQTCFICNERLFEQSGWEEYEWAGQRRVRATAMMEGGYSGAGFATANIVVSVEDEDASALHEMVSGGAPRQGFEETVSEWEHTTKDNVQPTQSTLLIDSLKARIHQLESTKAFNCLICLEPYKTPLTSIVCWHVHCEKCWLQTLGTKKLCPQCQKITTPADLRHTFLDNTNSKHLYKRANDYLFGRHGHSVSSKLAVAYLIKATALGNAKAEGVLGFCYEFGIGVETDFVQSEHHYLNAAKRNDGLSMARLAFLRKYGRPNVKIDRVEAEEWAERIRHKPSAIQWILEAASLHHDPAAQYTLGVCYHDGIAVTKDEHAAFRWTAMKWYRLAAEQGETVAIYNIGYCYEDGIGVEKDVHEAVKWYRLSAEQGNAFGQNSLGYCYEDGIGVEEDQQEAVKWYKLSAEQGYPWAECNLGYCYQNGIGLPKDDTLGAYWYRRAALQGHARAQHNLGFCYQNGIGVECNEKEAVKWYRRSAERGNIFAYHSLGYCYQNGIGVAVNEQESVFWYYLSAEENHPPAQLSLGYCYRNGIGVPKNEAEAVKWFKRSAEHGNALAQNSLGFCFEEGIGLKKDTARAVYWYHKSAKQNNPWAQCNLGFCYANGIGVQKDDVKAVEWYKRAAAQNHARALDKLGIHLQGGIGIQQDLQAAFEMFKRAAQSDHISAQFHLGNCFEKGLGCPVDINQATYWFERAALAGCRNSHERLRLLIVRECLLSPESFSSLSTMNEEDLIYGGLIIGHSAPAA